MPSSEIQKHLDNRDDRVSDPVLAMLGVGKQLWDRESGDAFVERLRSEALHDIPEIAPDSSKRDQSEAIWRRIRSHQGKEFHTARNLPFTYKVDGAGLWFFRNGRRINRKLSGSQIEKAISRCPLRTTTEIKDLMDYAYLFALLMDPRIKAEAW